MQKPLPVGTKIKLVKLKHCFNPSLEKLIGRCSIISEVQDSGFDTYQYRCHFSGRTVYVQPEEVEPTDMKCEDCPERFKCNTE